MANWLMYFIICQLLFNWWNNWSLNYENASLQDLHFLFGVQQSTDLLGTKLFQNHIVLIFCWFRIPGFMTLIIRFTVILFFNGIRTCTYRFSDVPLDKFATSSMIRFNIFIGGIWITMFTWNSNYERYNTHYKNVK